ncbi:MAG: anion permease, partial [Gammaproteobacteria bacterium]|nr:anion permease [Gammaproteobacteria bacterium]
MLTHDIIFIALACIFGLFMAWSVGANDLANIMSTTMASKAITVKQAIIVAIIFEIAGAVLGGGDVAQTLQNGIINTHMASVQPDIFIYGMLAALLASALWMTFASYLGMPVSITNAIVGAIVGFGLLALGPQAIYWDKVGFIALSWVCSPTIAGILAYILFLSVQRLILTAVDPLAKARKYIPIYLFLIGFILSEITVVKAFEHVGIILSLRHNVLIAIASGIVILIIGQFMLKRIKPEGRPEHKEQFIYVEKMFAVL